MQFWDASAVIPLVIDEKTTSTLRSIYEGDPGIVVWWGTWVECLSAIARRTRDPRFFREVTGRRELEDLARIWSEVEPGSGVRRTAERLLFAYSLRAADALQLAAAFVWTDGAPAQSHFVCLDARLRDAASREDFAVLPA